VGASNLGGVGSCCWDDVLQKWALKLKSAGNKTEARAAMKAVRQVQDETVEVRG